MGLKKEPDFSDSFYLFNNLARLAFFLLAVFLAKTPFDHALSTKLTAFVYNSLTSLLFSFTALSKAFIASLYAFLVALFCAVLVSITLTLYLADFIFGILHLLMAN